MDKQIEAEERGGQQEGKQTITILLHKEIRQVEGYCVSAIFITTVKMEDPYYLHSLKIEKY